MTLRVEWIDKGREPKCQPDPAYPDGKPIDLTAGQEPSCQVELEHPAPRCGVYVIACDQCGRRIGVTTAGRPDDPSTVKIPCETQGEA